MKPSDYVKHIANETILVVDKEHGIPLAASTAWLEGFYYGYTRCKEDEWQEAMSNLQTQFKLDNANE